MNEPNTNAGQEMSENEAAVQAWRHPGELIEADVHARLVGQLADVLTPIMIFIAKGKAGGTDRHRMWVWFYETRRDLYGGESIRDYAKRVGISHQRIHELVEEFRALVPAYHSPREKSTAARAKMRAAARARAERAVQDGTEGAR